MDESDTADKPSIDIAVDVPPTPEHAKEIMASTRDTLRRLLSLLDDPHPGLSTWNEAVNRTRKEVLEELDATLDKTQTATAIDFGRIAYENHHPFINAEQRAEQWDELPDHRKVGARRLGRSSRYSYG